MRPRWFFILLTCALGCGVVDALAQSEPAPQPSQGEATASAPPGSAAGLADGSFPADQLEQLVAPIALYPDSLLTQILMAATYPLEIVQADRFVKQNPDLKDDALDAALKEQDWDPSVKSLCAFPDVLKQMSENLDWTQDMGDAFLAQKNELMDTVQRMRGKAYDAGNLRTTEQQVVTQQPDKIIVIESSDPEVIYVPSYSPTVVYAGWSYPTYYYPPFYYPPPAGYGFVSFSFGVLVGGAIWGNCGWGWGHTDIDIDIDRYNDFNRNTNINADRDRIQNTGRDGKSTWQHDASHRKGVNYRSEQVAQRHGAAAGSSRVTREQARGRTGVDNRMAGGAGQARDRAASYPSQRPAQGDRAGMADRAGVADRSAMADRAGTADRAGVGDRSAGNRSAGSVGTSDRSARSSRSASAYSGSRSPSIDRMSSSRGAMSRGSTSFGGARGGGGFRGRR